VIAAALGAIFILAAVLTARFGADTQKPWIVVFIVVAGLCLWSNRKISSGVVAITLLGIIDVLNILDGRSAFEGFAQSEFFFFFALLFVTTAIEESGTARRVAERLMHRRPVTSAGLLWQAPIAMVASAVVVSSATARIGLIAPIAERVLQSREPDRGLRTYLTVFLAHLSPLTSRVFLSGGAGVIVAANLLSEAGYSFNWWTWFLWMGVPTLAVVAISSIAHWLWLRPGGWNPIDTSPEPLERRDKLLIGVVLAMVALWILGPRVGIGTTHTAIFGMALTAGVLDSSIRPMRLLDWDLLIFVGGTLSLGHVVIASGTAAWLGVNMAGLLRPLEGSPWILPALLLLFVTLRLPLHNGVSYSAIIVPIALDMGRLGSADVLAVVFIAITCASITFLPMQATSAMLTDSRHPAADREFAISGTLNLAAALCVIVFVLRPYWSLLRNGD
jgi:sodium-dependent dicarboxylate transporter 2/3/5